MNRHTLAFRIRRNARQVERALWLLENKPQRQKHALAQGRAAVERLKEMATEIKPRSNRRNPFSPRRRGVPG